MKMEGGKSFRSTISMAKIEATIEVMQKAIKELGHQDILQEGGERGCALGVSGHPSQRPPPPPWPHDLLDPIY